MERIRWSCAFHGEPVNQVHMPSVVSQKPLASRAPIVPLLADSASRFVACVFVCAAASTGAMSPAIAAQIGVRPAAPTSTQRVYFEVPVPSCAYAPLAIASSEFKRVASEITIRVVSEHPFDCAISVPPPDPTMSVWTAPLPPGQYSVAYEFTATAAPGRNLSLRSTFTVVPGTDSAPKTAPAIAMAWDGRSHLALVDVDRNLVAERIVMPATSAYNGVMEISADGKFGYVVGARDMGVQPGDYRRYVVHAFDLHTGTAPFWVDVGAGASQIAASNDNRFLYVLRKGEIVRVDLAERALDATPPIPATRLHSVSAAGRSLYATTPGGLAIVNLSTGNTTHVPLSAPDMQSSVVVAADGRAAYYASYVQYPPHSVIRRISVPSGDVAWSLELHGLVGLMTSSVDGKRLYATGRTEGALVAIDAATGIQIDAVALPNVPSGLAVTPDDRKVLLTGLSPMRLVDAKTLDVGQSTQEATIAVGTRVLAPRRNVTAQAAEYWHEAFDHYFMTNQGAEIELLDAGVIDGWRRTGQSLDVEITSSAATRPVCRFFSASFAPRSSHYYALRGLGCEEAELNTHWLFEGDVFHMEAPSENGSCPSTSLPVYRLYNDGAGSAPNHRFTTSEDVRARMMARGWIPEGNGPGVAMCSSIGDH